MRAFAIGALVGSLIGIAWMAGNATPPCLEDQAYVVARDANPSRGLTWICVQRDEVEP